MLRGLKNASSSWLGKGILAVVIGFLVISFAIWGIGDIFRGFGRNEVAKIGSSAISVEAFRKYYNDRLQQLGRQLGRAITPDQARALGFDRQILGQLVAETTLDEKVKDWRLGLTNVEIAQHITDDPNFRGPNGKFDRTRFEQLIRQAGYTEPRYVAEQRAVLLRRQIAQSVSGNLTAPDTALQALNQFRNETRAIEYLALGPTQAGDIPVPTPEQLQSYYDERKALFRAPEYRKLTLVELSPSELAKVDEVSEADAKVYYERHKNEYGKPEKREVRQIVFPTETEAQEARARIDKGESFQDIAKARGLKPPDTDLGMVTESAIIDPTVRKVAFSLKPDEVSQPIKGAFGAVLVTVGKIEPGEQKSFEEVKPQIKREIAETRVKDTIGDLRDKIEDAKASGATLAEAAGKIGLKARTIEAIDRSGRGADGNPVSGVPKQPDVVNAAFNSDVGVDNEALQSTGGGYLYFDVTGVTPSRERTLDEVRDKVEQRWRDDEISARLKNEADDIVAKLKGGSTFEQLAADKSLQVQKADDLRRGKAAGFVPANVVAAAFATPRGEIGSAEGEKETAHYVFRVTGITDPRLDPKSDDAKAIAGSLKNAYADDLIAEYVTHLEKEFGVEINPTALNQIIGGEPGS
jgi:peptidyl-prolyl cis-trans isomerase D